MLLFRADTGEVQQFGHVDGFPHKATNEVERVITQDELEWLKGNMPARVTASNTLERTSTKTAAQKVAEAQFKQICNMLQIQTPLAKDSFPIIIQTAIARFNSAPDQPTKDAIQNAMMQLHYLSGVLGDAIYAEDFGK